MQALHRCKFDDRRTLEATLAQRSVPEEARHVSGWIRRTHCMYSILPGMCQTTGACVRDSAWTATAHGRAVAGTRPVCGVANVGRVHRVLPSKTLGENVSICLLLLLAR